MFPCVSPWPPAEPPASCGHAPPPAQPLPDLLCSCPAHPGPLNPAPHPHAQFPLRHMESLIVVTDIFQSKVLSLSLSLSLSPSLSLSLPLSLSLSLWRGGRSFSAPGPQRPRLRAALCARVGAGRAGGRDRGRGRGTQTAAGGPPDARLGRRRGAGPAEGSSSRRRH